MSEQRRLTQNILAVVNAYRAVVPFAESTVSRKFMGSGTLLARLASPDGVNFGIESYDDWLMKFSANWPDGAAWPPTVPRPALRESLQQQREAAAQSQQQKAAQE